MQRFSTNGFNKPMAVSTPLLITFALYISVMVLIGPGLQEIIPSFLLSGLAIVVVGLLDKASPVSITACFARAEHAYAPASDKH